MADQETLSLISLGPFKGLDTRTAGPYAEAGSASFISNADIERYAGALCTERGRVQFVDFFGAGSEVYLDKTVGYIVSPNRIFYITQAASGSTVSTMYYDSATKTQGSLSGIDTPFTQAVQSDGILWLNNGFQIFLGSDGTLHSAQWQYPAPNRNNFAYSVTKGPVSSPALAAGRYSYAFVQQIAYPNAAGTVNQLTAPTGADASGRNADGSNIYPFQIVNDGNEPNVISGVFAGSTLDGLAYVTRVYRYSSNSPNWFLLTTLTDNNSFTDSASDQSISGNAQLTPTTTKNSPPPSGSFLAVHQDRTWTLSVVNNSATGGIPQTQVQYSGVGQSWSFDPTAQARLVENEGTTLVQGLPPPSGSSFGNQPAGLVDLGSSLVVFERETTGVIYGVDDNSYQYLKVFTDIGCIAPFSIAKGRGIIGWISAQGIFTFDGSALNRISEKITNLLESLGVASLSSGQGAFADQTFYWSFPLSGITLKYYLDSQQWRTLPYASPSLWYDTSMPSDFSNAPVKMNQIVGVRPQSTTIDFWSAAESDLGQPITAMFESQETDSGEKAWEKLYRKVLIEAPVQPGVQAEAALFVDGELVKTWPPFDLSQGRTVKVAQVPGREARGYLAKLRVTLTNAPNATSPAIIYGAAVGGTLSRAWIVPDEQ